MTRSLPAGRLAVATASVTACLAEKSGAEVPRGTSSVSDRSFRIENDPACKDEVDQMHLKILFMEWEPYAMWEEGAVQPIGYSVDVIEELSRLGGFSYSIDRLNHSQPNVSEGRMLHDVLSSVDLVGPYWTLTAERTRYATPTVPYLVNSFRVLAQVPKIKQREWYDSMFNFVHPFTSGLWYTLMAVILCSGFALSIIERGHWIWDTMEDGQFTGIPTGRTIVDAFYMAFGSFTGAAQFEPKTLLGRIVHVMHTFMILISVAAYTAELAAQLSMHVEADELIANAGDFQEDNLPMCFYAWNSLPFITMTAWYQDTPWFEIHDHSLEGQSDHTDLTWKGMFDSIRSGDCFGSLESTLSFEHLSYDKHFSSFMRRFGYDQDPTCNFHLVGRSLVDRAGAFLVSKVPSSRQRCILSRVNWATSVFTQNVLLMSHLRQKWFPARQCGGGGTKPEGHSADQEEDPLAGMSVLHFAGVFIIHGSMIVFAFSGRALMWLHRYWVGELNPERVLVGKEGEVSRRFQEEEHERKELQDEVEKIAHQLPGNFEPSFFKHVGRISEGGVLHKQLITLQGAKCKAARLPRCRGFCFHGEDTGGLLEVVFKDKFDSELFDGWTSYEIQFSSSEFQADGPASTIAPQTGNELRCRDEARSEAAALREEVARLAVAVQSLEARIALPDLSQQVADPIVPSAALDSFAAATVHPSSVPDVESLATAVEAMNSMVETVRQASMPSRAIPSEKL